MKIVAQTVTAIQCRCGETFYVLDISGQMTSCPFCDMISGGLRYVGEFRNMDLYKVAYVL